MVICTFRWRFIYLFIGPTLAVNVNEAAVRVGPERQLKADVVDDLRGETPLESPLDYLVGTENAQGPAAGKGRILSYGH